MHVVEPGAGRRRELLQVGGPELVHGHAAPARGRSGSSIARPSMKCTEPSTTSKGRASRKAAISARAVGEPVHLDAEQHRQALLARGADRRAVGVGVLGRLLPPEGVVEPVVGLGEAVDVLGDRDLRRPPGRGRGPRSARSSRLLRCPPAASQPGGLPLARLDAVRLEVHVVVGQHAAGILTEHARRASARAASAGVVTFRLGVRRLDQAHAPAARLDQRGAVGGRVEACRRRRRPRPPRASDQRPERLRRLRPPRAPGAGTVPLDDAALAGPLERVGGRAPRRSPRRRPRRPSSTASTSSGRQQRPGRVVHQHHAPRPAGAARSPSRTEAGPARRRPGTTTAPAPATAGDLALQPRRRDHHDGADARARAQRVEAPGEHRAPRQRHQRLGDRRAHADAGARGDHDRYRWRGHFLSDP